MTMPTDVKLNAEELPDSFLDQLRVECQWEYGEKVVGKQTLWRIVAELQARRALDNSKPTPAVGDDGLIERLRAHARMIGMMVNPKTNRNSSADLINEAITALTAADACVVELEREAAQWQAAAGQSLVRAEALEDRLETVERERDEARVERDEAYDGARQFRLRANAAEAEVSRLKAAFRDISSFSPDPASHIGPFEQIARHARATTLAALSNQAGASK